MQDLSGKAGVAALLDNWVIARFKTFLTEVKSNSTLSNFINSSNIVFFFHLLGVDVAGHASKPHST